MTLQTYDPVAKIFTGAVGTPPAGALTDTDLNTARTDVLADARAGLAPLASPTLTGVPAVPTAAPGTSTTQAASTAFVAAAVVASTTGVATVNGRTGAVTITSSDVTTALTFTPAAVTSSITPYAPAPGGSIGSQTTAARADHAHPTASVFTSVANGVVPLSGGGTTNYLRADGTWVAPPGGSGNPAPRRVNAASSPITILASDGLVEINNTSGAALTINLEASPVAGTIHRLKDVAGNLATYAWTIVPASGTIDGAANFPTPPGNNRACIIVERGTTEWVVE